MNENETKLEARIPGSLSASVFEGLQHEKSRLHILGIVKDYTEHVDFMGKVKKYAGEELDSRMFVSIKFWIVTASSAAVSAILAVLVSKLIQ